MLLVTGGAGFIGSNVVTSLNEAGRTDIVVNDVLGSDAKWRNLGKRQLADVVPPGDLFDWLDSRKLDAVIHLGAISDTTASDAELQQAGADWIVDDCAELFLDSSAPGEDFLLIGRRTE